MGSKGYESAIRDSIFNLPFRLFKRFPSRYKRIKNADETFFFYIYKLQILS